MEAMVAVRHRVLKSRVQWRRARTPTSRVQWGFASGLISKILGPVPPQKKYIYIYILILMREDTQSDAIQ